MRKLRTLLLTKKGVELNNMGSAVPCESEFYNEHELYQDLTRIESIHGCIDPYEGETTITFYTYSGERWTIIGDLEEFVREVMEARNKMIFN